MKSQTESRSKKEVRLTMANIYSERARKVVKYLQNNKDECQLAKPRYAHHGQALQKRRILTKNYSVEYLGNLVEPMISAQPHLSRFRSKFKKDNEQQHFQSTMTVHQNESTMTKSNVPNRVQKQMNLNKEIMRRLGLLSTQAKRAMDMEKLSNRALKIKSEADSIPAFNKKTFQIVAKQIKQQEQAALQQHRCTTSASAAARMALTYQESKLNEILSERRAYTTSGASRRNRPKTRETQTNVKQFYLELAQLQLENQDHIKEEEQKLGKQMFEIKEDLGKCKKQLLDYNDEIEIALTQEIIGQVIEYRNSLLLKGQ